MLQILSHFSLSAIKTQLSKIWKTIAIGILISFGGAGFTVLVAKLTGNAIWVLAKDPASVEEFPSYVGMLSNWDVVLWIITATICLFSAIILKQQKASNAVFRFLAVSGTLSLLLGIDDLYMLHERVFPKIFHVSETFFYLLYFFAFAVYLAYFAAQILEYDYLLLMASFLFFATSRQLFISIPYFNQFNTTGDMLKYFGIVFWLAFFYRTALHEVNVFLSHKRQL